MSRGLGDVYKRQLLGELEEVVDACSALLDDSSPARGVVGSMPSMTLVRLHLGTAKNLLEQNMPHVKEPTK